MLQINNTIDLLNKRIPTKWSRLTTERALSIVVIVLVLLRISVVIFTGVGSPSLPTITTTTDQADTSNYPTTTNNNPPSSRDPKIILSSIASQLPSTSSLKDFLLRSKNQGKRGYEAIIQSISRPARCVPHSLARLPHEPDISIIQRLDEAMIVRQVWAHKLTEIASGPCQISGKPMMDDMDAGLLLALLRRGDRMLEWGAGRSTCIWSQAVGELHSVDDSSSWVSMMIGSNTFYENQMLHWITSFEAAPGDRPPSSMDEYNFYVHFPFKLVPECMFGQKFDVILVDGRARPQCAYEALLLIKDDGVLVIHDWETTTPPLRPYYRIVLRWYELVHVEKVLAVFRVRRGKTATQWHGEPGVLPGWWTKKQDVTKWNVRDGGLVSWVEPFESPLWPSDADKAPISVKWQTWRQENLPTST